MDLQDRLNAAKNALSAGQVAAAEQQFQLLVQSQPDNPEYRLQYALCLVKLKRLEEALAQLDWLHREHGPVPPVAVNRGEVLRRLQRYDEAIEILKSCVQQHPQLASARFNLALSLRGADRLDEAVTEYRQALLQHPDNVDGWFNLGNVQLDLGQVTEAIDSYQCALNVAPPAQRPKVLNNLASAYIMDQRPSEAIAPLRQALAAAPDYFDAELNLAKALELSGELSQAGSSFRRLAQIQPDQWWHELHAANLCPDVYGSSSAIDEWRDVFQQRISQWSQRPGSIPLEQLHQSGAEPTYKLMYQGREDRQLKVIYAQMLADRLPAFEAPAKRRGADRLRIGMVVSRGHEGIFTRSMKGMLPHFDRGQFEIVIAISRPVMAATQVLLPCDHIRWLPLSARVDQAAEQLRHEQLDVLYHWEVGTDTFNYFLPWFRCAPVQYTSWAWPVTTGIPGMDFFLSSDLVEPDNAQSLYSESLISMKSNMFTWAEPPAPSMRSWQRSDFGLSDSEHLYLCHQNPRKVHPDFDALVAQILQRDSKGRLLLIGGAESNEAALLQQRLQTTLGTLVERVSILPRMPSERYLGLLQCVDVALDPPHYTGANTSFDAFGMGLPVVTQRSTLLRGNFTSGLYQQMGQTELIARSAEHYVELALSFAQQADRRAYWRHLLMEGRECIFYDPQSVTELESAWIRMAGC